MANVYTDTPYFEGEIDAYLKSLNCDHIIGNVQGVNFGVRQLPRMESMTSGNGWRYNVIKSTQRLTYRLIVRQCKWWNQPHIEREQWSLHIYPLFKNDKERIMTSVDKPRLCSDVAIVCRSCAVCNRFFFQKDVKWTFWGWKENKLDGRQSKI